MRNVAPIFGGPLPGEPSEAIVAEIERLLVRAKSGELTGLAFAGTLRSGRVFSAWVGIDGTKFQLGCSVSMLHLRYMRMCEDEE